MSSTPEPKYRYVPAAVVERADVMALVQKYRPDLPAITRESVVSVIMMQMIREGIVAFRIHPQNYHDVARCQIAEIEILDKRL